MQDPRGELKLAIWRYLLPKRKLALETIIERILQEAAIEEHRWLSKINEIKANLLAGNLEALTTTANQCTTNSFASFPIKKELWDYVRAAHQSMGGISQNN